MEVPRNPYRRVGYLLRDPPRVAVDPGPREERDRHARRDTEKANEKGKGTEIVRSNGTETGTEIRTGIETEIEIEADSEVETAIGTGTREIGTGTSEIEKETGSERETVRETQIKV